VLYALDSKVLPPVTETLFIAERFRQILMGTHKRIAGGPGHVSPHFSGKDAAGTPLRGQPHAFYVPLDRDHDGRLDHLAVVCRDPLDDLEQVALDRMARIWHSERLPDIRCTPVAWGSADIVCSLSRKWTSATPFVTPRFYRRGRGDFAEWVVNELRRELAYLELPPPARLELLPHLAVSDRRPLRWQEFRRSRKGDLERLGYGFALEFEEEVSGPFAVGYGAHFGLGLFVPD
jgi:CRISPR-associated protein Csb2